MHGNQENQNGEKKDGCIDLECTRGKGYHIIYIYDDKHAQLDEHLQQITGNTRKRNDQSREINFSEHIGIGPENITAHSEALREIPP